MNQVQWLKECAGFVIRMIMKMASMNTLMIMVFGRKIIASTRMVGHWLMASGIITARATHIQDGLDLTISVKV